ncbi:hypothetical protein ACLOJK_002977 [Asimina triloba]
MADKLGPAFMLRLGLRPTLVVSSWEVAKECFTTNDKVFASRPGITAGKLLGYNYAMFGFAPYGPYWREMRKIATLEVLSNRQLESLKHIRANEVGMSAIDDGDEAMVGNLTFNVTNMMVAGKRCFGTNIAGNEEEARRFRHGISELLRLTGVFVAGDSLTFLEWLDLEGHERAMKETAKELDGVLEVWLEEHRVRRASGEVGVNDFMDVLISITEEAQISGYDRTPLSRLIHCCNLTVKFHYLWAIILGGTDTTAVTLVWALTLLLNNPQALEKAQDELDRHVGRDRRVDESDIKDLVYLQAIAKETMRLYPAAPLSVPHEAAEDCFVGGYHIPAGTQLLTNIWKLHRDPNVWSDPWEFRPERFLTSHADLDVRGQHFEYIPFGSGRRSCTGISFALQVLHLSLANLMHGFDLATPGNEAVDMTESIGLTMPKEKPLEVFFSPRRPSKVYA